jgi:hypothetical protein
MIDQTPKTITGTVALLPNPCTTKPCLPGMALAVIANDSVRYFLIKDSGFYMQDSGESKQMPASGNKVVARGDVQEKLDITGNNFKTIEVTTLPQAKTINKD